MAQHKKKKTTITVDRDGLVKLLYDAFKREAAYLEGTRGISKGECLSRALYLFLLEAHGDISMRKDVEGLRKYAQKNGLPFNEKVVLDNGDWVQYLRDQRQKIIENYNRKHRTLDNG
ncbi:hypothetical protein DJ030_06400 [bacterium endosymbiont of Escarpia laminata]|nr:MAG: hypothetical protein DJ030_06400 [bacterium endosymbiont of Escarpia laminata]